MTLLSIRRLMSLLQSLSVFASFHMHNRLRPMMLKIQGQINLIRYLHPGNRLPSKAQKTLKLLWYGQPAVIALWKKKK